MAVPDAAEGVAANDTAVDAVFGAGGEFFESGFHAGAVRCGGNSAFSTAFSAVESRDIRKSISQPFQARPWPLFWRFRLNCTYLCHEKIRPTNRRMHDTGRRWLESRK